jgi:hypothetical protein
MLTADSTVRLWTQTQLSDGCWEWQGVTNNYGYGRIRHQGRYTLAHRLAYELAYGPIPDKLQIHHRCANRRCIRPGHLQALTHREHRAIEPSPAEINAAKTHCHRGHPFTAANTRRRANGRRDCLACARDYSNAYYRKLHPAAKHRRRTPPAF